MFAHAKKIIVATLSTSLLLGFLFAKPFQTHGNSSQDSLVVGLQSGYPPFEFMNSEGKFVGFDVEVAECLAEKLGKKLVIKNMEFDGLILSLKQGKIDLILSGMNITPSRLKEISLVPYHGETSTSLSLIFWNEIPKGIESLEDFSKLANPAVSVEAGTITEQYLTHYQNIQAKPLHGALEPLMDVMYGKSTACLVQPDVAEYLKMQHPEIKILNIPLTEEETILGFGIGIKQENQELAEQVGQIINELKTSGDLKKAENKWFKGEQ